MYKILPNLTKVMNLATRIIKAIELEKQTNKSHHVYNTHWLLQIANIYLLSKVHTRLHRKLNDSIFWSSNFFCINVIMKHNIVSPCNFKILNFRISRHLAAKKFPQKIMTFNLHRIECPKLNSTIITCIFWLISLKGIEFLPQTLFF